MDYLFVNIIILTLTENVHLQENIILLDTMQDEWRNWKTNSGKYSGWRSQNIPPEGDKVYGLCMVHRADNDNWLYSPIIPTGEAHSIIIETYFSMRNCRNYPDPTKLKTCEDTIHLLTYETNDIRESTDQNNRLFKQTSVLFPENKWSKGNSEQPAMNSHKVSIPIKSLGIRIGYRDTGSCTMIRRVRVLYLVCPAVINSFTSFSRTVSKHYYELVNVFGKCVKGAIQKVENADQLQSRFCQSNGLWHDMGTINCHCGPGFTASTDWKACIPCASGTYKSIAGPVRCSYCPKYSQSELGQSSCKCEKDYFKKIIEDKSVADFVCLKLPSSPRDLKADITDGSKVILTWKYPNNTELNEHDSIEYFRISCYQCSLQKVQFLPGINITSTSVTILGLDFGQSYLFFVTSLASISNYSNNLLLNPSQASVRLFLPKSNSKLMKSVKTIKQNNGTFLISWTDPETVNPVEMYLIQVANIILTNKTGFETVYEYIFTSNTEYLYFSQLKSTDIFARVKFKSEGTWSDFSSDALSNVILPEIMFNENTSQVHKSILSWIPNLDVVFLCITSVVIIVIILSVLVILMRKYVYVNMKSTNSRKIRHSSLVDNTKSSYASITASSPSRPRSYFYLSSVDNLATSTHRTLNEIQPELIIMKTLSRSGRFYDVYSGNIKQPRRLAMNITLYVFKIEIEEEIKTKLLEDCRDISQFQHENLINILGFCTVNSPKMVILEFMSNGCLNAFLKKNSEKLTMCQLLEFLRNIGCGMHYLSERKFIHKKLSTHNIFIDESLVCKISMCLLGLNDEFDNDSGCKYIDENKSVDAISWMAPEIQRDNTYSTSSDVWAYGVTMWEILSHGEKPYWDWCPEKISKVILEGYRLPPPKNCHQNLHLLMLSCWILDSSLRPSFLNIIKNLDQLMGFVEKQLICLENINQSVDGLKSTELPQDCMHTSYIVLKNNRNASLDNINIDNFQSLKQKKSFLSNKSITNAPSMELGTISSNTYVSTSAIKSQINYPNFKERYSIDNTNKIINSAMVNQVQESKINLNNWLSEIKMRKYKKLLMKNGYSSRNKLAHISIADLTEMGIKKASEIQVLMNNAHQLRNNFSI